MTYLGEVVTTLSAWAVVKANNGNPVFCRYEKIGGREVLFQSDILNECIDWLDNWYEAKAN